jgi:dTDP-4-dehydrorhamnose 3,5-epimerase
LGVWVDLRPETFGTVFTADMTPGLAVFVPRGVANGYQTVVDGTAYVYLVTDHWRPDVEYVAVNHADPELGIDWPVPVADRIVSVKDAAAPPLADVERRLGCPGSV